MHLQLIPKRCEGVRPPTQGMRHKRQINRSWRQRRAVVMVRFGEPHQSPEHRSQQVYVGRPKADHDDGKSLTLAVAPYEQAHVKAPYVHV